MLLRFVGARLEKTQQRGGHVICDSVQGSRRAKVIDTVYCMAEECRAT